MLLGIDIGTTHCKSALFTVDGQQVAISSIPSPVRYDADDYPYYDPDSLWQTVRKTIQQVTSDHSLADIRAVGVASMAETGLLLDRRTGEPKTNCFPWFSKQAETLVSIVEQHAGNLVERFAITGIRPNYKCAITKLLWLQQENEGILDNAVWLSASDYIVFRLTHVCVTDYSLAGRTYAFDIHCREWDRDWLQKLGLPADIFPDAHLSGTVYPSVDSCLAPNTPVCVAGHDHVCAAFAAGTTLSTETMLDSMGTAETLLGSWSGHNLGQSEYDSGLLFGCHVVADSQYWMGSLSASGGSIEWLRNIFDDAPMNYDEIDALLESISEPSGILYFPYLAGSSSNGNSGASFVGLKQHHNRAHMLKAAIEGTAYEIEYIRNTVESILDLTTKRIVLVGGGTRSPVWLQVKADISGCDYYIYPLSEATLLGAAMIAGIGSQVYSSAQHALGTVKQDTPRIITSQPEFYEQYRHIYEKGYLKLMNPLQAYYAEIQREQS